ncbi:MAG: biotin/lipoyl-containing protein, partial [Pseudomonadota bacterium]
RDHAVARMTDALNHTTIVGPSTNLPLLRTLMVHPDYLACEIHTAYLDQKLDDVLATFEPAPFSALAAATLHTTFASVTPASPWAADGWQANSFGARRVVWRDASGEDTTVTLTRDIDGWLLAMGGEVARASAVNEHSVSLVRVTDGQTRHQTWNVHAMDGGARVQRDDRAYELSEQPLYPVIRDAATDDRRPGAPMPGRIVKVLVAAGASVEKGQPLLVMEGMKMELTITAAQAGTVKEVRCAVGDQVEADVPLVELDAP